MKPPLRKAVAKEPRLGLDVASAYRWTDPEAVVPWLEHAGGAVAATCDEALKRAIFYEAAGRRREAQQVLERCKPQHRWEESCVGWVRARVGR